MEHSLQKKIWTRKPEWVLFLGFLEFFFFFLPLLKNFMTLSLYPLHLYSILQFQRAVYFILPNLSSTITITWPGWKDRPCHLHSIGEKTKLRIDTWLVV